MISENSLRISCFEVSTQEVWLVKQQCIIVNLNKGYRQYRQYTPWPQSARELYRQSGRRRLAKLVPTFADRGVSRGQRNESPQPLISVFQTWSRYFFHSSSSSIDLTRPSGPCSRPTTTQKIWQRRGSNPGPLHLQPETLTTRPQRRSGPIITIQKQKIVLKCRTVVSLCTSSILMCLPASPYNSHKHLHTAKIKTFRFVTLTHAADCPRKLHQSRNLLNSLHC